MVTTPEFLLAAYQRMAEKVKDGGKVADIDKDYLIIKLDAKVTAGELTQEQVQPIVDILTVA